MSIKEDGVIAVLTERGVTVLGREHFIIKHAGNTKRFDFKCPEKHWRTGNGKYLTAGERSETRCPDEGGQLSDVFRDALIQSELRRLISVPLRTEAARRRLSVWMFAGKKQKNAYACFYNRNYLCLKILTLCEDGLRMRESYSDEIVRWFGKTNAKYFSSVHNHIDEPLVPSPDDLRLTFTLRRCAKERLNNSKAFLGHYITDGTDAVLIEWD